MNKQQATAYDEIKNRHKPCHIAMRGLEEQGYTVQVDEDFGGIVQYFIRPSGEVTEIGA
jgi:hypothetical protein